MRKSMSIVVVLAVLVLANLACGSSSTGTKVGESGSATSAPAKVEIYKVGDVIAVSDHTITLNQADVSGNIIKANFTVENKGTKDLAVSSIMSFSAKDSEGTKLDQSIVDCDSGLDGKVLPGDKLKGNICWSGATKFPVKLYYEAGLFSSGAVVWEVQKP